MSWQPCWSIEPGKSAGPLALGMTFDECIALLGDGFDVFRRTKDSKNEILAYNNQLVHLELDDDLRVRTISVFRPREVELKGVQVLGREIDEVAAELEAAGLVVARVDAGLYCPSVGVVLVEVEGMIDGVEVSHMPDADP